MTKTGISKLTDTLRIDIRNIAGRFVPGQYMFDILNLDNHIVTSHSRVFDSPEQAKTFASTYNWTGNPDE